FLCSKPKRSHESEVIGWQSPQVGHAAAKDGAIGRPTASSNADRQRSVDRRKGKGKKKSKKSVTRTPPSGVAHTEQNRDSATADTRRYAGRGGGGERRENVLVEPPATRGWKRTASGNANATAEAGGHRAGYGRKESTLRETKLPSRIGAATREAAWATAKSASTGLDPTSRGVGHQLAQAGGHLNTGSRAGTFSTGSRPGTFAGGAQRQMTWPADRGRPQVTVEKAPSWLEIWPKLRREGWHWDYGEQADSSCVYLKPGVSKNGATLGVDMFDSKHAVIAHVLKHATSSATPHAAEHTVVGDSDGDENIDVVDGELSSNAWLAAAATGQGKGQSAGPGVGRAAEARVPEKKRGVAVFHRHCQGDLPFPAVKRGRVEQSQGVIGGKDAAAESGDEIEVAASLVMEMLRGEMEESVAMRSVESATQQLDAKGGSRGEDKLTAHCCEQLLALSESGSGAAAGGSDGASASGHCEGGDLVTGKVSVDRCAENGGTGRSDSDDVDVVENDAVPLNHLLPISRASSGSANAGDLLGVTHSSSDPREGPLAGVGVILAGLGEQPRQEMEAKIRNLGAEVVDIFGESGGWRSWLLRESTPTVANSGATAEPSARHASGSGDCNGDPCATANSDARTPESTNVSKPQMRMIAVAVPGSDRTPEFQLAVAAGMPIVHPSYVEACSGMEIE
ncbi:unnamed protein product, partial [Ectocarpus sp. 8 AP-2014]